MARKPLIRIAVVESDPLRLVGFQVWFDSVSGFDLVLASLPDIGVLQSIGIRAQPSWHPPRNCSRSSGSSGFR